VTSDDSAHCSRLRSRAAAGIVRAGRVKAARSSERWYCLVVFGSPIVRRESDRRCRPVGGQKPGILQCGDGKLAYGLVVE
jgi:hypothetical protein